MPDIADQWMSGSIGLRQRIVSRANSRNRRKLRIWSNSCLPSSPPTSTPYFWISIGTSLPR